MDRRSVVAAAGLGLVGSLLGGLLPSRAGAASGGGFHFVRIFEGTDGRSYLEEYDPRQAAEKFPYFYRAKAKSAALLTFPAGTDFDWHLTHDHVRRLLVTITGMSAVIVDDGSVAGKSYYPLKPGSVFLAEDFAGRGHRGKVFSDEEAVVFQVDLAD